MIENSTASYIIIKRAVAMLSSFPAEELKVQQ